MTDIVNLLEKVYVHHDHKFLLEYLESRCIGYTQGLYYVKNMMYENSVLNGVIVEISSVDGGVSAIEYRSSMSGKWSKLYQNPDYVPIWGVSEALDADTIVITESVIDSESINQLNIDGVASISFLKSSFSLAQFHYSMFLFGEKNILTAFDNDESGNRSHDRFEYMANRDYGVTIGKLKYPYKDINEYRCKSNRFAVSIKTSLNAKR